MKFTALINAIANEFENTGRSTNEPVSVYVGLKRVEGRRKIAELGDESLYQMQRKNIFSYRATDRFTRQDMGHNFFFKTSGIEEKGKGTQSDDLKERVECIREQMHKYADVDRGRGVKKVLMAKRGEYVKMGDLLYYAFDVSLGYKTLPMRKPISV